MNKIKEKQENIEKYIRANFYDCLEQFGLENDKKRVRTLSEEKPAASKPSYSVPHKQIEPIKVNEEGFEYIIDIFAVPDEEFNELFGVTNK